MRRVTLCIVLLTSFGESLIAQGRRSEIPIATWQPPTFWDAPSRGKKEFLKGNATSLVADVGAGAVPVGKSMAFVAIVPCRLVDTRGLTGETGAFGPPRFAAGEIRTIPVSASTRCNLPPTALAYSLNFTVVPNGSLLYLSAWPSGNRPTPDVSILNDQPGQIIANAAIVPGCSTVVPCPNGTPNGSIDVFATNDTDVIIDINGYYADVLSLAPGSAGAPTVTFGTDPTTGIYSAGAGTINIATGGQTRVAVRSDGDLDLTGNIRKNGLLFVHNRGFSNTAIGESALAANTTGTLNTAIGTLALRDNTTGQNNTAAGAQSLLRNSTGSNNTAYGEQSLYTNTTGHSNTAVGVASLSLNSTGMWNTAVGSVSLTANTTGQGNTAVGVNSLFWSNTGSSNTANGGSALFSNLSGSENSAFGTAALYWNIGGNLNTAAGTRALLNTTGSLNMGLGSDAGIDATTGSYNIFLGANVRGSASDTNTIRIGLPYNSGLGQNRTFIAGIRGFMTGSGDAVPVVIDSSGQLGTISSSRRFKDDISDMAASSDGLLRLRPVTFHYKESYKDGTKPVEYGLIAEEVAEVYPDLVVKGADGQVETIQYQKLTPMLVNEVQKLHRERAQDHDLLQSALEEIRALKATLAEMLSRKDEK